MIVCAVGQFKELVLSAERDQPLQEHLRKVMYRRPVLMHCLHALPETLLA